MSEKIVSIHCYQICLFILLFPELTSTVIENMSLCQAAKSIWCHTVENKMERKSIFDFKMYISYLCCYYHNIILLSSKARPWQGYVGFTDGFCRLYCLRHQFWGKCRKNLRGGPWTQNDYNLNKLGVFYEDTNPVNVTLKVFSSQSERAMDNSPTQERMKPWTPTNQISDWFQIQLRKSSCKKTTTKNKQTIGVDKYSFFRSPGPNPK